MENTTQNTQNTQPRPIGFWLRAADRLIAREFAIAFESEGVTRREWMILNVLDGSVEAPEIAARVQRGGKKLHSLVERGRITETDGVWTLTDEGRAAKARLGEVVDGLRSKVAGAVSDEDFATTLASLEAIARELGWDENERLPRGGHRRGFGRRGFGPGFRPGFGPGFGRGFGPGFGPGVDDERGFGPRGFGGHPHRGHGRPECDERTGRDEYRGHGRGHRHAEHAYERGFDAGFSRGREEHGA